MGSFTGWGGGDPPQIRLPEPSQGAASPKGRISDDSILGPAGLTAFCADFDRNSPGSGSVGDVTGRGALLAVGGVPVHKQAVFPFAQASHSAHKPRTFVEFVS